MSYDTIRICKLEKNVAELADIIRILTWGLHGNGLMQRGIDLNNMAQLQLDQQVRIGDVTPPSSKPRRKVR